MFQLTQRRTKCMSGHLKLPEKMVYISTLLVRLMTVQLDREMLVEKAFALPQWHVQHD